MRVLVLVVGLLAVGGCAATDTRPVADSGAAVPSVAASTTGAALAPGSPADTGRSAAATRAAAVAVPNVVGQRLTSATGVLAAAGLTETEPTDGTGQDRAVLNSTNWLVTSQRPAAGTRVSPQQVITLVVVKPSDSAAGGDSTSGVVPDVVCKDLQTAQDTLQAAGFFDLGSEDGTGQGRSQLVDRNWVVIAQSVPAGSTPGPTARVVLTAVKFGESTGGSGCPS